MMSTPGRGRGYTGRHQRREPRPGVPDGLPVADLSPRSAAASPGLDKDLHEEPPCEALQDLLHIDDQYRPLLTLLEQFSPGEDGIQFNRKLKNFESSVTALCPDEPRLTQAFSTFRAAALQSAVTARKLAAVGASFTRQQRQQLLRATLLNVVMQGAFCKLDLLERSNPLFLINAANLMGDYFAEARLCNGNKVHILASPLLQYLRALLASDDCRAHRSLATQLMQNGRELLSVLPEELDALSVGARRRLLAAPAPAVWLLLAADLCLNKFLPLPNSLQQFYAARLELTSDDHFSEVHYGSWKKSPEKDEHKDPEPGAEKPGSVSQISLSDDDSAKPKLRPILGAGAGLLRQEQALSVGQDSFETWNKSPLTKRYDLNSWRQAEEELKDDLAEPVFNPTVLPPNFQVPDYPPPNIRYNYPEPFPNYLQQGDGAYIQSQFTPDAFYPERERERPERTSERTTVPDRPANDRVPVTSEVQKTGSRARPVENWRKEKLEGKDDKKPRNWSRNDTEEEDDKEQFADKRAPRESRESRPGNRQARSSDSEPGDTPPRRHVSDVPRNHKYWDHDDRCDKDYVS